MELDELVALAEAMIRSGNVRLVIEQVTTPENEDRIAQHLIGLAAGAWEPLFRSAKILDQKLADAKSARARSTLMGAFLARHIGRQVEVEHQGATRKLTLQMTEGRGKTKLYYFAAEVADGEVAGRDGLLGHDQQGPQSRAGRASTNATGDARATRQGARAARHHEQAGNTEDW